MKLRPTRGQRKRSGPHHPVSSPFQQLIGYIEQQLDENQYPGDEGRAVDDLRVHLLGVEVFVHILEGRDGRELDLKPTTKEPTFLRVGRLPMRSASWSQ